MPIKRKDFKEFAIGSKIEYNGKLYEVVKSNTCDDCSIANICSNCDRSNNDNEYFSSEEEDEVREHKIIRLFNAKQQNSKAEPDNGSNDNKKEDNKLFVKYFTASGKLVRSAKFICK